MIRIAPDILAALTEAAPGRLIRKLDKDPQMAESWEWQKNGTVTTINNGKETVTYTSTAVTSMEQISCTCLLAPRCLHILASASLLIVEEASAVAESEEPSQEAEVDEEGYTEDALNSAAAAYEFGGIFLSAGLKSCGADVQGKLLRCIHDLRKNKLYRPANKALSVLKSIKDYRAGKDGFSLADFSVQLSSMIEDCRQICEKNNQAVAGTARRKYNDIGSLKLTGLFSEAVATGSEYAGAVTYLAAADGRLFTVNNILPGLPSRVYEAWEGGVSIGDVSISQKDLVNQGLLLQNATSSKDSRLGAGKQVKAVKSKGAPWDESLFKTPLNKQLHRAVEASKTEYTERAAGSDLLFLEGSIMGICSGKLLFVFEDGQPVLLRRSSDHSDLKCNENFDNLSRSPGVKLRCICRLMAGSAGEVTLLAVAPLGNEKTLKLPKTHSGKISVSLEEIDPSWLPEYQKKPVYVEASISHPDEHMGAFSRYINNLVLGGRHSFSPSLKIELDRITGKYLKSHSPRAAALLQNLSHTAMEVKRDFKSVCFPGDSSNLVRAWLACSLYLMNYRNRLDQKSWGMYFDAKEIPTEKI